MTKNDELLYYAKFILLYDYYTMRNLSPLYKHQYYKNRIQIFYTSLRNIFQFVQCFYEHIYTIVILYI